MKIAPGEYLLRCQVQRLWNIDIIFKAGRCYIFKGHYKEKRASVINTCTRLTYKSWLCIVQLALKHWWEVVLFFYQLKTFFSSPRGALICRDTCDGLFLPLCYYCTKQYEPWWRVSQNSSELPEASGLVFCGLWTAQWEVGRQLCLSMELLDGLNNSVDATSVMLKAAGLAGDEERWWGPGFMWEACQQHLLCLFIVSRAKKKKILNTGPLKSVKLVPWSQCNGIQVSNLWLPVVSSVYSGAGLGQSLQGSPLQVSPLEVEKPVRCWWIFGLMFL